MALLIQEATYAANNVFDYPLKSKTIVNKFLQPKDNYSAGHRGVDFEASVGDKVYSVAPGRVIFSGQVASKYHITIDHGSKIVSTYTYVSKRYVQAGDVVSKGKLIGNVGEADDHKQGVFHFSMRVNGAYVDPLKYINGEIPIPKISLAPLPKDSKTFIARAIDKEKKELQKLLEESSDRSLIEKIIDASKDVYAKSSSTIEDIYNEINDTFSKLDSKVKKYIESSAKWTKEQIANAKQEIKALEKTMISKTKALIKEGVSLSEKIVIQYERALKFGVQAAKLFVEQNTKAIEFLVRIEAAVIQGVVGSMNALVNSSGRLLDQYFDVDWSTLARAVAVPFTCVADSCVQALQLACNPLKKFKVKDDFIGTGNSAMLVSGLQSNGSPTPLKSDKGDGTRVGQPTNIAWNKLGYEKKDVFYYSYAGLNKKFKTQDTYQDLRISAGKMDEQVRAWKNNNPKKTLDILTHSLGGAVVSAWLVIYYDPVDSGYPKIGKVIMFAPPLTGTQLATAGNTLDSSNTGLAIHDHFNTVFGDELIPPSDSLALDQLVENGDLEKLLKERQVTKKVKINVIRAAHDPVVTTGSGQLEGSYEKIITTNNFNPINVHTNLTTDPQALSVAQDMLANKKPACLSVKNATRAAVSSSLIHGAEIAIGESLGVVGQAYDQELLRFIAVSTN